MEMESKAGTGVSGSLPFCKCVFKASYSVLIEQCTCSYATAPRPTRPVGLPWAPLVSGMEGQFSVEAFCYRKGFLFKKTSFISPSVSSHRTIWGRLGSSNILKDSLALSSHKHESVDWEGLTFVTPFTSEKGTLPNCLSLRICYK